MKKTASSNRFRFNFIDVLLICVVLAAAVVLVYIFTSSGTSLFGSSETVTIEYTVEVRQVREEFRDLAKIGDMVTETVTQYDIGEVIDVSYVPGIYTGVNRTTGSIVVGDYPEHINVTLTIRAKAVRDGSDYSVGGFKVAVGRAIAVRAPYFTGEGFCTTLMEVTAND